MSKTTKEIIFWMSTISAGLTAITASLAAAPGDVVSNELVIVLLAVSGGLAAMVAFATRQQGSS
jgi:hypothetical protein